MASVNKVIVIGNLGADPELRHAGAHAVCELRVATTEKRGEKEETEWHRCVLWGKTAENAAKYLKKGRQVYVEGRIRTRTWEKDGEKKYATEIIADRVQFLGGERSEGASGGEREERRDRSTSRPTPAGSRAPAPSQGDDDIPF